MYTMDELDQALDKEDVKMVSINVAGIEKEYGLYGLPLLIHFNGNIPRVFDGKTLIIFFAIDILYRLFVNANCIDVSVGRNQYIL